MRLPRPRVTVRRLMIATAIVAISTAWGIEAERRRAEFSGKLFLLCLNRDLKQHNLNKVGMPDQIGLDPVIPAEWSEGQGKISRWLVAEVEYHNHMVAKYKFASRYPWLPVLPDPPEPEY